MTPDVDGFTRALVSRDVDAARAAVAELRAAGSDVSGIYVGLLAPALKRVGELWASGEVSVAEEHVASSLVEQLMASLYADAFVAPRRSRDRVLVAAPQGERHVIGLRMVADLLEGRGFDVVFLGADTPAGALAHALSRFEARAAVLAAYTPGSAACLREAAARAREVAPGLPIVAGGDTGALGEGAGAGAVTIAGGIAEALPMVESALA
jgi:cobalamin-dependent methionine synthase I